MSSSSWLPLMRLKYSSVLGLWESFILSAILLIEEPVSRVLLTWAYLHQASSAAPREDRYREQELFTLDWWVYVVGAGPASSALHVRPAFPNFVSRRWQLCPLSLSHTRAARAARHVASRARWWVRKMPGTRRGGAARDQVSRNSSRLHASAARTGSVPSRSLSHWLCASSAA